ncbi:dUTP diphosphatase [Jeotgalibacillus terrae]|uniref:dUTP diphosphatase n=1 Tax=Jeotgalibacillus terrae TaxID=587735 RepID=A0ABW5ZJ86_9BACL|nr:dUTP diphosphatase [Jeotgalibacillus terrae]MBM7578897.1 dimeric dUTPase (all-alpha-NTP-PPase superfamily) [Jeotgalibacillus terrae]
MLNWDELYHMQNELDSFIERENNLTGKDLLRDKLLALSVEAGELANETRCFKFWSRKGPSEKSIILEEYVDGIHFLLSIGLEKDFRFSGSADEKGSQSLTDLFIAFNRCISAFELDQTKDHYIQMWHVYLAIGEKLSFSAQDTIQAYIQKNKVNVERQKKEY